MSGLVLIVGALLLAAGGYEMLAGSGDILSERGWSAFIAGSVLVAGGVVTVALGIVVRAIERLRGAIVLFQPAMAAIAAPAERAETGSPADAPIPVALPVAQPDLFHEPTFEEAAPVLAANPIERDHFNEPVAGSAPVALAATHVEPEPRPEMTEPAVPAPEHDDWLDHSFADLEREMAVRHEPVQASAQPEPAPAAAEPVLAAEFLPLPAPTHEPHAPSIVHEEPPAMPQVATADLATISAREEPAPTASPVIGRYESEGTSYVMYADGSIDAQSEAGVYRFASMAELKSFIES